VVNELERAEPALAALVERYALSERQHGQLRLLLEILAGDSHAPTSIRSPEQAVAVHLADSLVALELEQVRGARVLADLGAGAGFPGLALAVALEDSEVRLVESQKRKCAFITDTAVAAGIENARIVRARAEDWPDGVGMHDLIVARALAPQPVVLEYAAPLLQVGGAVVDWRGKRDAREEQVSSTAALALGLAPVTVRHVFPFPQAREHHLHVFEKTEETPERFPRRAGVARKRPLGG
jgi:16S rRNA (guanine527-N7)-methyltransferase